MDDFIKTADKILHHFIKKSGNRYKIAESLWKQAVTTYSDNDNCMFKNPEPYAMYLLYELSAEFATDPKVEDFIQRVKNKRSGWDHPVFRPFHHLQKEYDDFLLNPPEVEEGVIQCHRCGSKKTFSFSKQTRRADESATVFVRCAECNKSFKM